MRPPPYPTLFPYTTLFRSQPLSPMRLAPALAAFIVAISAAAAAEMTAEPIAVLQGLDKITARVSRFEAPVGREVRFGTLDRKSTRLNSSHSSISYAVFCLK